MTGRAVLVAQIDAALDSTPPGPWSWTGHNDSRSGVYLGHWHDGVGRCMVMGFDRLGMRAAQPTFRQPGNGFPIMYRAVSDGLCVQEVTYRTDVVDIDNPTARLIAAAPTLLAAARDALAATLIACPSCDGSGVHVEDHGLGMRESLGCLDCRATGRVDRADVLAACLARIADDPTGRGVADDIARTLAAVRPQP